MSLGVVMHELITGQRLFRRENDLAVYKAILEEQVAPPTRVRGEGSDDGLDEIVRRAPSSAG